MAAKRAFDHAGEVLGEAIASMNAVVDGIVVIGGGIIAAHKYLMPAVMRELNGTLEMYEGAPADRMEMKAFSWMIREIVRLSWLPHPDALSCLERRKRSNMIQ